MRLTLRTLCQSLGSLALRNRMRSSTLSTIVLYLACIPISFDPEDISTGGTGDLGLDGIAIIVNDNLVRVFLAENVDYFRKTLRRLDVQFHFIQTKTSSHFDAAEIGTIFSGVRCFFEENLPEDANSSVRAFHDIKEYIYDASVDMDGTPRCSVHFVTTGSWNADPPLVTTPPNKDGSIFKVRDDFRLSSLYPRTRTDSSFYIAISQPSHHSRAAV